MKQLLIQSSDFRYTVHPDLLVEHLFIQSSGFEYIVHNDLLYETNKKILSFNNLLDGWNYGEGVHIQKKTIASARDINDYIRSCGFFETDAFPVPDGSIMTTLYHDKDYLEFIIHPDKSITYIREKNKNVIVHEENQSSDDTKVFINKFRGEIWSLSDSSIQFFTTSEMNNIKALHSLPPGETAGFLSSQVPA